MSDKFFFGNIVAALVVISLCVLGILQAANEILDRLDDGDEYTIEEVIE